LVPGQVADIAIFSRNLLTATPEEILHETQCNMTLRGGEIVFTRD
jgi:predicted amidohydrolase YtcJ